MKTTKKYNRNFRRIHFQKDESFNNITLRGATSLGDVKRDEKDYNNLIFTLNRDNTKVNKSEYDSKIENLENEIENLKTLINKSQGE